MKRPIKTYELKLYDDVLLRFEASTDDYGVIRYRILEVDYTKQKLFPLALVDEVTAQTLSGWIDSRVIPKNRKHIEAILLTADLHLGDTLGIIEVSKGLSVNDSYWVTEEGFDLTYKQCNLYDNPTNEWLSLIANHDRHAGNYGFLRDNHTGELIGLAPIFDNNVALFAHDMESDFSTWSTKVKAQSPWMSNLSFDEHLSLVLDEELHASVNTIKGFEFVNHPDYPLPQNRLDALNVYIASRIEVASKMQPVNEHSFVQEMQTVLASLLDAGSVIPALQLL